MLPGMQRVKKIHFVGIGGNGMGSIAEVLINEGYQISGSDLVSNSITKRLIDLGAYIFFNHQPENICNANVVVVSNAIAIDNPEIIAARKARIPVIQRAEMLSELMRFRHSIVVAGTHGKTTTTSMIVSIYIQAGFDPTFVNGEIIKTINTRARLGSGRHIIVEADESDASFLSLQPMIAVITNIEADHMDTYHRDFENLKKTFINFLHKMPFYGRAIMCIDDPAIREILPFIKRQVTTYGFSDDADFRIIEYHQNGMYSNFIVLRKRKLKLKIKLFNAPGKHNALNAMASIVVASEEGIDDKNIFQAMQNFQGTKRRFDNLGRYDLTNINGKSGNVMLIDDYGHHPTEIKATIQTIRIGWPGKRLVMIFQPHRYTRTRDLYEDFSIVLSRVDVLLILDIYPAGELPISGIDGFSLCRTIRNLGIINPIFVSHINKLSMILELVMKNNDLVLIQGAGTIGNIVRKLIENKIQIKLDKQLVNDG
nr:UDP-N-acetylmuramate--L-alanine ligase [Sodalis sp. CWE]